MTRKILSILTLVLLVLNAASLSFADGKKKRSAVRKQADPLVAKLPASDAVALIDARRFFDQALPQLLSANQPLLAKLTAHINEFQTKTGIDARKFDRVVIGANIRKEAVKDFDVDFVALARGSLNAGALIAGAKLGSNAGYREEKVGNHTIYIFSTKSIADKNMPKSTTGAVSDAAQSLPAEIAITALDANTLAIGSLNRVRESLEPKTGVSAEITGLLASRANSVFAFAGRMPEGVRNLLPMDNDELGKNIDSIKFMYGWADVAAGGASMSITAKTAGPENAQGLYDTLVFLQQFGKGLLGNSKKPENAVFARLVESAKVAKAGADVSLDLTVAQSDVDLLMAILAKK
jgi:hypothetical protein